MSKPVASVAQQEAPADLSAAPSRFVPMSIEEALRLSKMFYDSGLMPKHFYEDKRYNDAAARRNAGIAGVCTMVLYGAELGLSPMQAIRMMHVVEGRPVLSAAGKVALVKRSGRCRRFDVIEVSDDSCTCETVRIGPDGRDEKPRRLTVKAWRGHGAPPKGEKDVVYVTPKNSSPWQQYPSRMLKARCSDWLCGEVFEDVVAGLYSAEEIVDFRDNRTAEAMVDSIFDMVAVPPAAVSDAGAAPRFEQEELQGEPAPARAEDAAAPAFDLQALLDDVRIAKETGDTGLWPGLHERMLAAPVDHAPALLRSRIEALTRSDDKAALDVIQELGGRMPRGQERNELQKLKEATLAKLREAEAAAREGCA